MSRCGLHQEVNIAKGEAKQKSLITNEETFEGFFQNVTTILQHLGNVMTVALLIGNFR